MFKVLSRLQFIFKFWRFIPFLGDYFLTNEVKLKNKLLYVLLITGYILFPFDLLPDFLAGIGVIDDVIVAGFFLDRLVKGAPTSLKEKHKLL
ncbi:YkvA family protein [Bacillus sp. DJP31]|uniref:YkvA family protein n=1 Tax=Bacillus sp. DJP31 TaxID=3409789 RepID=UPI003BB7372F